MRKQCVFNIPVSAGLVLATLVFGMACGRDRNNHRSDEKNANKNADSKDKLPLVELTTVFGLRTFDQLNETMAALTGVDPNAAAIKATYKTVRSQLPSSSDIKSFLGSHQVGVTKLAAEYCDSLINNPTLRVKITGDFNFALSASQAFAGDNSVNLINAYIDSFWGKDLEGLPDRDETVHLLETLTDDLLLGENTTIAATTVRVAKGICTAVLASSPVTVF